MSIWDSLRNWLRKKPAPTTRVEPRPPVGSTIELPDAGLPDPGDTPVDLIRLLFNRKDKYQTTMLNSISLSTDMKTLYLIDNGRSIPFDLTVPEGVLIGLLGKQLVVATGIAETSGPVLEGGGGGEKPAPGGPKATGRPLTFKTGKNSQYALNYNGSNTVLGIIGTDNVVIHLEAPDTGDCVKHYFDLSKRGIVKMRHNGKDALTVEQI